jgi:murein DD-endopeptidase MepM/ murein hydrolase activator NlpD
MRRISNWFKKHFSRPMMARFFKRYGAITAGLLCAGIVGIVYAITWNNGGVAPPAPTHTAISGDDQPSGSDMNEPLDAVKSTPTPKVTLKPVTATPAPTAVSQQTGSQSVSPIPKMLRPVEGKVLLKFARDSLVYSETLRQWSTHLGVDIQADEGTDVRAVLDGVVEKVAEDELMGLCVYINHKNDMKSAYCALAKASVTAGQNVKRGDVIGKVGNSATCEIASGDHLHFEFYLDGTAVNAAPFFVDQ